jgi:hypothetical protein
VPHTITTQFTATSGTQLLFKLSRNPIKLNSRKTTVKTKTHLFRPINVPCIQKLQISTFEITDLRISEPVAHSCNSGYSGGRFRRHGSMPARENSL